MSTGDAYFTAEVIITEMNAGVFSSSVTFRLLPLLGHRLTACIQQACSVLCSTLDLPFVLLILLAYLTDQEKAKGTSRGSITHDALSMINFYFMTWIFIFQIFLAGKLVFHL